MPNRKRKIDPYKAAQMLDSGTSVSEIAALFDTTASGVYQALRAIEYKPKTRRSHKKWLPWVLRKGHYDCDVATYIRRLSTLAQGGKLQSGKQNHLYAARSVMSWAEKIVESGMDYDYDRLKPPNDFCSAGGFFLREADPSKWKIKNLLEEVRRVQSRIR